MDNHVTAKISEIIDGGWAYARHELDHPDTCRFSRVFTGEGPAWPVEYGLRLIATEATMLVTTTHGSMRIVGIRMYAVAEIASLCAQLHAAVTRLHAWPTPAEHPDWPKTPGIQFLGRTGESALDAAIKKLVEIDEAIIRWSGHVLDFAPDGRPSSRELTMPTTDGRALEWFDRSASALEDTILRGEPDGLAAQEEVESLLIQLKREHEQYLGTRETSGTENQRGVGKGGMKWQDAIRRGEAYVSRKPFPGVNALAKIVGCSAATMSKAIKKSPTLAARKAELEAKSGKVAREVPMTEIVTDGVKQTTETNPLDALIAEQSAEMERESSPRAAKRRRR